MGSTTSTKKFEQSLRSIGRAMCLVMVMGCGEKPITDPYQLAENAVENGDYQVAKSHAKKVPRDDPHWADAQVIIGGVETANRYAGAGLPYYESVPRDGSTASLKAVRAIAEIQRQKGALSKSAENYRYFIEQTPQDFEVRKQLATILADSGQRFDAESQFMEITEAGASRFEFEQLVLLTEPDRPRDRVQYLTQCAQQNAQDPYVNLGLAISEAADAKVAEAKQRLEVVLRVQPELAEAQALKGELVLDAGPAELQAWYAAVPAATKQNAGVWYVCGLWARQLHEDRVAARCFWEVIRQRPHHRRAMFRLGQVMQPIDPVAGAAFTQRAADLKEYSEAMERTLINRGRNEQLMKQMISLLVEMGREWEALAWTNAAVEQYGPTAWPSTYVKSLAHLKADNSPRFLPDKDLSRIYDLSSYPDFGTLPLNARPTTAGEQALSSQIHFTDQAKEQGLDFTYFQSPDARTQGVRIFESTGGGVGVLDFDLDGQPDLYLTQGENWNRGDNQPTPSPEYRDRLYRQSGAGFQDVTDAAGLGVEDGYGQGCSVGDFNNDGYPDLYVGNIGANQLLMNNGDGTFSDVTQASGLEGSDWTTSCLVLDLNADGNPDLYDVNYLQGEKMFSIECGANRCSVRDYAGAPDRVQLSRGDGTFETIPGATPTTTPKGLGIVALFMNQEPRPSLFVANDQVPNFFLRPTEVSGKYTDQALLSGLAVNMDGQPTACMGVASGDLNHDQLTDLFVTNFEGEANNLYMQRAGGFFEDAISGTGLKASGIPYVGWGTQFIDADNDRELDIVVANGHVADFGASGVQYQMPTQLYRNTGMGRFVLLPPSEVGPLFDRKVLGRSIAIVDWNRDQKPDFVQSSIAAPVLLATNDTSPGGHSLSVRLHARTTARDAFGTIVEVHQGDRVDSQQLLAGNGYQVTNERLLHFGLGASDAPVSVTIHWPSGTTSTFDSVPVDTTVEVAEGMSAVTLWKGTVPTAR